MGKLRTATCKRVQFRCKPYTRRASLFLTDTGAAPALSGWSFLSNTWSVRNSSFGVGNYFGLTVTGQNGLRLGIGLLGVRRRGGCHDQRPSDLKARHVGCGNAGGSYIACIPMRQDRPSSARPRRSIIRQANPLASVSGEDRERHGDCRLGLRTAGNQRLWCDGFWICRGSSMARQSGIRFDLHGLVRLKPLKAFYTVRTSL